MLIPMHRDSIYCYGALSATNIIFCNRPCPEKSGCDKILQRLLQIHQLYMIRKLTHSHRKFLTRISHKYFSKILLGEKCWLVTAIALLLSLFSYLPTANGQAVIGARELGMGQATTALQGTSWSIFANPAMMSEEERSVAFFGVRYFGFAEISDIAASVSYPTKFGTLGAGVHRYGFDLFNESRLRIGYKNSFMGFHFGGVINYSHVAQGGGYGSAGAIGFDIGIAAPVIPNLWIGAKATNINQPEYGSMNDEKLPRNLSVGLSYQLSDIALFTADVMKDVAFPISYRSGVEISIIGGLVGRAGVSTSPETFTAGFGYTGSFWSANVAVTRHENEVLGYSPAIDFKIKW